MLEISEQQLKRVTLLVASGRINSDTVAQLESRLTSAIEAGQNRIVVDLAGVTFISSAGLRALLSALKAARRSGGGDVRLAAPSEPVNEVLQLAGLTSVFQSFDSQVEAVGSY